MLKNESKHTYIQGLLGLRVPTMDHCLPILQGGRRSVETDPSLRNEAALHEA